MVATLKQMIKIEYKNGTFRDEVSEFKEGKTVCVTDLIGGFEKEIKAIRVMTIIV